jgi:hypothetical protein
MEKEFVPYEIALELKELGFESSYPIGGYQGGKVFYYENGELYYDGRPMYSSDAHSGQLLSPLYQQAFRWFREKYNLQCWPEPTGSDRYSCRYDGNDDIGKRYVGYLRDNLNNILFYKTYEEAELDCLIKLIEIVKNK